MGRILNMKQHVLTALLILGPCVLAQNVVQPLYRVTADPANPCTVGTAMRLNTTNSKFWGCVGPVGLNLGHWFVMSGSGAQIASGSVTFGAIVDGACADQTLTFTGLVAGSSIAPGLPASLSAKILSTFIANTDSVTVRLCNLSGATVTPGALSIAVTKPGGTNASSTIDFAAIADGVCLATTFAFTGAVAGAALAAGWPSTLNPGLQGLMRVSSAGNVEIRLCNWSGATVDPASAVYTATLP